METSLTNTPPLSTPLHFRASDHQLPGRINLLLACTGSVATIKLPQILSALCQPKHHGRLSIRLILTRSALEFLQGQSDEQPTISSLLEAHKAVLHGVHLDHDEWSPAWTRGSPILHIELRRWGDGMLIAPLSANTMAKMVAGFSDNLVLSVIRAWDTDGSVDGLMPGGKPKKIIVAAAMNTAMWRHPITKRQMKVLEEEWGQWVEVLRPVEKELACGDVGDGAMKSWEVIVGVVEERLGLDKYLEEDEVG